MYADPNRCIIDRRVQVGSVSIFFVATGAAFRWILLSFPFFFFCFYTRPSPFPRLAWTEWLRSHLRPSVDLIEVEKTLWKTNNFILERWELRVCCLILLQVAFDEMQNKVKELNNVIAQNPPDMKKLQLVLQGSVSVQVWIRLQVEIARMLACISGLNKKPAFDRLSEYSLRVQEHNRHFSALQSIAHTFPVIWLVTLSEQSV